MLGDKERGAMKTQRANQFGSASLQSKSLFYSKCQTTCSSADTHMAECLERRREDYGLKTSALGEVFLKPR